MEKLPGFSRWFTTQEAFQRFIQAGTILIWLMPREKNIVLYRRVLRAVLDVYNGALSWKQ